MEEATVTAATGALLPVIAKLASLLGREYKLRWRTRRDVRFVKSKFTSIHTLFRTPIWEMYYDLDVDSKVLKLDVLDLADDMDDAIDDFILCMEPDRSNRRLVQTKIKASPFKGFKQRVNDVSLRCHAKRKKASQTMSTARKRTPRDPFVCRDASELVGMEGPRDEIIQHLVGEVEPDLKMAAIFGMTGMGKTTLARLVYEEIGNQFQARAFLSLTPSPNMKEVLASILEQVAPDGSAPTASTEESNEEEHLIKKISDFLKDTRYLVIIDDIWQYGEWLTISKSFPRNNLGSRIVTTTRTNNIANKWRDSADALIHKMDPVLEDNGKWVYKIGDEDVAAAMIAMKADLLGEGFDCNHPDVRMHGGVPLALHCMFSAVEKEVEQQKQQGNIVKPCDAFHTIAEHVRQNGIQNTPGFTPLVESLQLVYDDLPHHVLKTCLLNCTIYPEGHDFVWNSVIRRWIAERFVYEEEAAKGYAGELVNRGFVKIIDDDFEWTYRMHPVMRHFLRWKSREYNFVTCTSDIPSLHTSRIRRLCIDELPRRGVVDPLSRLDWSQVRSLFVVVDSDFETVPLERLERLRLLDLQSTTGILDHHVRDMCGLVRLRHLLGLTGEGISMIPPEIERLQHLETLEVCGTDIKHLPSEIGNLQRLRTLVVSNNRLEKLPKDILSLQRLSFLDINRTEIKELQKEIFKLQHLKHLIMDNTKVAKIPREIMALKELVVLTFNDNGTTIPLEVCQVSKLVDLPECIQQACQKSDVLSSLAGEILSIQRSGMMAEGGLVVGAKHMHIPRWIRDHFNDLALLDIRICRPDEEGLGILGGMRNLEDLTLRFEVVPREAIAISAEGFAKLKFLVVDSRVPRICFQEGAMPLLNSLTFKFQFYGGPPNNRPLGINHLKSLESVCFECNKDWYGVDSPCIGAIIDVTLKEAREHPNMVYFFVTGRGLEHISENRRKNTDQDWEVSEEFSEASSTGTAGDMESSYVPRKGWDPFQESINFGEFRQAIEEGASPNKLTPKISEAINEGSSSVTGDEDVLHIIDHISEYWQDM